MTEQQEQGSREGRQTTRPKSFVGRSRTAFTDENAVAANSGQPF